MKLDITSLGNAVRRLREGLARYEREPVDEQLRDGLIQRFLQRRPARPPPHASICLRITDDWYWRSFARICRGAPRYGCSARGRAAGRGAIPISIRRSTPVGG
jgi:hypothetical protein